MFIRSNPMIKSIHIQNFKSIESLSLDVAGNDIVCFIGKNGSGKSNIFKAIDYFFRHINKPYSEEDIIDNSNPYLQKCIISIAFNLKMLKDKSKHNAELTKRLNAVEAFFSENHSSEFTIPSSNNYDLSLQMTQYKDGTIQWNIKDKYVCDTIKSLFPLYYIDTRKLDIFTWEHLWKIISDLSAAMPQVDLENYQKTLDNAFRKIYGDKYESSKDRIEKAFHDNEISLDPYHFESRYKNAFSMRFGGELFLVDGQPLEYFSDGTNSYKYLVLLSTLIPQISEISCKYPIILMDEPEIGLHSEYITDFINIISQQINKNALMLFSTHSPKLIVDLTNSEKDYLLFRARRKGIHSIIHKMNTTWMTKSNHKVTVREAECYFYDYLVYVEGETEVELFNHKRIINLFPKLKKIHFYSFDSNHERLKSVNSKMLNLGVDYRLIIDMDQVLSYKESSQHFKIYNGNDINPINTKSTPNNAVLRYYNPRGIDIFSLYSSIKTALDKYSFSQAKHYIDDEAYNALATNVQMLCRHYNTIVNWSTIEGELITYENIEKFIEFISTIEIQNIKQHEFIVNISDSKEKAILILCEFYGKTEFFEPRKGKRIQYDTGKTLVTQTSAKTSGWVSKWINYYFDNYIDSLETYEEKLCCFGKDFPGLTNTLQQLENMVK